MFYFPVILACYWWEKRGLIVPLFLSGILIFFSFLDGTVSAIIEDLLRSVIIILVGIFISITSKVISEKELKIMRSQKRFKHLVSASPTVIYTTRATEDYGATFVSENIKDLTGYKSEQFLYNSEFWINNIHPEDKEHAASEVLSLSEKGRTVFIYRFKFKDATYHWIRDEIKLIKDEHGNPIECIGSWVDITKSKELEQIKSDLLTRFSHEFKTPLISIKGFTDFLLAEYKRNLDEKTISFLKKIKEGGNRLKLLINSFVECSQLDKGKVRVSFDHENLTELINDGLEDLEGLIKLREHSINLGIDEQLNVNIDKTKIYTVITNLLLNAINYTPKGGKISIQSYINSGSIIVSIGDNGIGLNAEEIDQLFKPFGKIERYGKGWDIVSEGMGMGLYISKEIIDLHGGKIWAESKGRNQGTTFFFSLSIDLN